MLKIQINSNALLQTDIATLYVETLPNRIQAAQFNAVIKSKQKIKENISTVARAAKYLEFKIIASGSAGIKMSISPYSKNYTRKDGGNLQIASAIVLTGRKGGGYIYPKSGSFMKIRKASVAEGYPEFVTKVKKTRIVSKRKDVKEIARNVLIQEIRAAFTKQGFGAKGAVKSPSTDIVRMG